MAGAYGTAATQASKMAAATPFQSAVSLTCATAAASLRSWQRRARRSSAACEKPSACRCPSSTRSSVSSSTASSHARSTARASRGPRSPPSVSSFTTIRSIIRITAAGSGGVSSSSRPSDRTASAIAACAHLAAEPWSPKAPTRPARTWARNSSGVAASGVSDHVRPMSTPAWSSEPPIPIPPWVSM